MFSGRLKVNPNYELIGKHHLAYWMIPNPQKRLTEIQLYTAVSDHTGLPLYDLSGPEPIQVYPPIKQILEPVVQEPQSGDRFSS